MRFVFVETNDASRYDLVGPFEADAELTRFMADAAKSGARAASTCRPETREAFFSYDASNDKGVTKAS